MTTHLLAHDLGTSGNKATLFTDEGRLVASRTCSYPTRYFHGNWAEQEPDDWWRAVCTTTRELVADIDPGQIACVALSGQMMGCTPVDAQGRALRPSIIYCDQRADEQALRILQRIRMADFYRIVGHRVSASYSLEKLMWVRDHEPDVFRQTDKTLCAKDYINLRLTGEAATDYSDASGTNAFDLNRFCWSEQVLELAGLDLRLFPPARPSTDILGTVTPDAAAATGLRAGTPVAVGGGDGSCAGVGVGCVKPGSAYNYLGSSSWIALTVDKPIVDPQMRTMNWAHCVPGYLHPSGTMQAAGSSYHWLKETVCTLEQRQARETERDVYELINEQIERSSPGAGGLIFLPYMLGERTPRWNPKAKGAFIGLSLATRREDLLRAVLEGITMNLGIIVNIFRQHVPIEAVTVIGGGAKGAVWRQILADVYGCPIQKLNYLEEATSMGAAVVGGVAAGVFDSFDVIDRFVRVDDVVSPNRANQAVYQRIMPVFDRCYDALVGVYEDLAGLLE
ncbi:MAG TPA: xylulokinase [Candidatus Anammoximicrobium sp.]|nr:xylulokinase [Candidatus Anammoximicrobium sp.]